MGNSSKRRDRALRLVYVCIRRKPASMGSRTSCRHWSHSDTGSTWMMRERSIAYCHPVQLCPRPKQDGGWTPNQSAETQVQRSGPHEARSIFSHSRTSAPGLTYIAHPARYRSRLRDGLQYISFQNAAADSSNVASSRYWAAPSCFLHVHHDPSSISLSRRPPHEAVDPPRGASRLDCW